MIIYLISFVNRQANYIENYNGFVHLIQYFVIQLVSDLQQDLSSWLVQFPLLRTLDHLDIQVHIINVWLTVAYKTNKHLIRKDMGVSEH